MSVSIYRKQRCREYRAAYWGVTIVMDFSFSQVDNFIMLFTSNDDLCTSSFSESKSTWQNAVEKWTKACEIDTGVLLQLYRRYFRQSPRISTLGNFLMYSGGRAPDHGGFNDRTNSGVCLIRPNGTWFETAFWKFSTLKYRSGIRLPSKTYNSNSPWNISSKSVRDTGVAIRNQIIDNINVKR